MENTAFAPYGDFFIDYVQSTRENDMKLQHYHDTYEIYLQISGNRKIFLNGSCYPLGSGDLYILSPFEIHYTESLDASPYRRYVMNFPTEKLSCILNEAERKILFSRLSSQVIHLDNIQAKMMCDYFTKTASLAAKTGFLAEKQLYAAVFQLLMALDSLTGTSEEITGQSIPKEICEAIRYINRHYHEAIDLETLADAVHLSKYHFCRLFHAATGATFLEYLYNIRLANVHQMLIKSTLPLHEIARQTGFASTAHLSRIFRQIYGQSPRDFRASSK